MNTITTDTIKNLGLLADLNAARLSGEGWTAAHSDAVGIDRFGKVTFNNGQTHELVLPIGLVRKWTRLLDSKPATEIGVEFDKDNRLKLLAGASQITFNERIPIGNAPLPTYILNAEDKGRVNWHDGEFKLASGEVNLDDIKNLRKAASDVRRQSAIIKLCDKERAALKALRQGAKFYCDQMAQLDSIFLIDAIAEAKAFRDARRFARKTLEDPTQKPDWLLTQGKTEPPDDFYPQGYTHTSESENFDIALAKYVEAKRHLDSYKPKWAGSRAADEQREKRGIAVKHAQCDLNRILKEALCRRFGINLKLEGWRAPGDAADGWYSDSYHRTRRRVRHWKSEKAELATTYMLAREIRKEAQGRIKA